MKKYKIFIGLAVALGTATGCMKNSDIDHPDFDHQAVYFAYQYPVRTIVLGEDLFIDNTLDNEHKVEIKATIGGTRENKNDVSIDFNVDGSLLSNLNFSGNGGKIQLMPSNYYSLASNQIIIPKGSILGGVQVQLTDAFFADPLAVKNTYVLPLKMANVKNADSILTNKNFVLYAIKFINPWHGYYLRRGADVMTNGATVRNVSRHAQYVENDEVNMLSTTSFTQLEFPVVFKDQGDNFTGTLLLTFDNAGKCTITASSKSPLFTATGTGSFVKKGEKKSWGNTDRDALYLDYQVNYAGVTVGSGVTSRVISGSVATKDTLVMRDRAVKHEVFTPVTQ
jgi:hypothetical protein